MDDGDRTGDVLTALAERLGRDKASALQSAAWLVELALDAEDAGGRIEIVAGDGTRSILHGATLRGFRHAPATALSST